MSEEQAGVSRVTGEAAWRAQQAELDRRNAAAKRTAKVHSTHELAAWGRERRLARAEELQLEALNERIAAGRDART